MGKVFGQFEVIKQFKVVFGQGFYQNLNLPARYLMVWMQLRANCLPIRARFKRYSK
jgi:hypothetical protein